MRLCTIALLTFLSTVITCMYTLDPPDKRLPHVFESIYSVCAHMVPKNNLVHTLYPLVICNNFYKYPTLFIIDIIVRYTAPSCMHILNVVHHIYDKNLTNKATEKRGIVHI